MKIANTYERLMGGLYFGKCSSKFIVILKKIIYFTSLSLKMAFFA